MRRIGLSLLAVLMLSACSSGGVSDRYAFWRDDNDKAYGGNKPNLADVPVAPDTQTAQNEMNAMRQRLETDRNNAYLAAQGYDVPADVTPVSDSAAAQYKEPVVTNDELAPVNQAPVAYNSAPQNTYPQYVQSSGNVQINYAPANDNYVYGNSVVQYQQGAFQQQAQGTVAVNPNVSINFDALGDSSSAPAAFSPSGVSGQPLIFFTHGSARLGAGDRAKLKELAQHLKQQPQSVVVIGHASKRTGLRNEVSSRAANLQMSAKRASVVMKELARYGVKPQQLHVTAQGDTQAQGRTTEKHDRRVDVLFD